MVGITMQVSVGGQAVELPPDETVPPDADGRQGIRLFGPCVSPDGIGEGCTLFEDPATLHLAVNRWYPSSLRIFDGSLVFIYSLFIATHLFNNAHIDGHRRIKQCNLVLQRIPRKFIRILPQKG